MSLRILLIIGMCLGCVGLVQAKTAHLFPRPQVIEHDVQFWKRVYSEISTQQGFIHDDRHLNIVYEKVQVPEGLNRKQRRAWSKKLKRHYAKALISLAKGKTKNLNRYEQRVRKLWPKKTSKQALLEAKQRVRFQLGQSDKFKAGLKRSGAWKPYIKRVLKRMELPLELAVLPHVESSFNAGAYSKIGAAGMWQFTNYTGKLYMTIDSVLDERLDPLAATIAAAKLLKTNHNLTSTWPLALTAYNHGAGGMRRASSKLNTTNIEEIIRRYNGPRFGFASRNFYVSFLAALEIDREPEKYFGKIEYDKPVDYVQVRMPAYVNLSTLLKSLKLTKSEILALNPAFTKAVINGQRFVPKGYKLKLEKRFAKSVVKTLKSIPRTLFYDRQKADEYHVVRRGESLSKIAAKYRVSWRAVMKLNQLKSRHKIRIGQRLKLPVRAVGASKSTPAIASQYTVKKGDTLAKIAKRHRMSLKRLVALNQIKQKHKIFPGMVLTVGKTYVVKKGDSLDKIAKRHGKKVSTILALNNISNKNRIYPGQTLIVK